MSLPLLAVLALPLCLAPWQTHRWFAQVYAREKAAIAVDNGAILLGRGSRSALESARRALFGLISLEGAHDLAHSCARIPSPASAECVAQDLALERTLEIGHASVESVAAGQWVASRASAVAEGARLAEALTIRGDSLGPLWERTICPVCGMRFRFRWRIPPSPTLSSKDGARVGVRWTGGEGPWSYRLIWGQGDGLDETGSGAF